MAAGKASASGISRCGALDKPAMTIANLLVGNAPETAALEITLVRSMYSYPPLLWFALTGAACEATLDGAPVWLGWRIGEGRAAAGVENSAAWDPPAATGGGGRYRRA